MSIFAVMTRLANEHGAINLSQGFPDFDCEPALVDVGRARDAGREQPVRADAGRAGAARGDRRQGPAVLRRARRSAERSARHCGATAGLYATLTAFVQPGDEVILFEPCYDSYVPVIRLSGGTPVFVSLRYPDYRVDWDEVRRADHAAYPRRFW